MPGSAPPCSRAALALLDSGPGYPGTRPASYTICPAMARDPDALFEKVSRAVADGDTVDWDTVGRTGDAQTRAIVEELRVLAEVARLHRDTLPDPSSSLLLPPAPLQAGDNWGDLTIRGELGRGARGHVYRAWDPQLDREVALKLTSDKDEARGGKDVIGEARLLARVKHPNVATVYGAERRAGLVGLWMELIEGETLETMLLRVGRFNAREAALVGIDVCAALSAVHGAGLLHRDIKAQNVMRDRNGRVVLMDFGTGRDVEPSAGAFVHDEVGTPLYMAPELFEGAKASIHSDIYSVGVLLYRLVTGSVPVEAHSPRALKLAHQSGARKQLTDVRSDLPLAFARVVERALAPEAGDRYASVGALEMALAGLLVPVEPQQKARSKGTTMLLAGMAAGTLIAASALGAWWWWSRPAEPREVRLGVYPAGPRDEVESVALAPDGSGLAYTSAGRLHVRRMNDIAPAEIEQSQGARDPFWSPDGQWVAFFKGVSLWKVRASGGEPQTVASARRPSSGSWGPDGSLLFSIENGTTLMTVPAAGGTPRVVRAQQPGARTALWWPSYVGDGSHFVYSAVSARTGRRMLYLARTGDGPDAVDRELLEIDSNPIVVGTRLFYTNRGRVKAQHLDLAAGRLTGEPVTVAEGVRVNPYAFGEADVAVAITGPGRGAGGTHGMVAFVSTAPSARILRIVDATGRTLDEFGVLDTRDMRVSPQGTHVAYEQVDPETNTREIWVLDLHRRSRVRLTQHDADDIAPMWSRDGRTVYYLSRRNMRYTLFATSAQGGQHENELFRFSGPVVPHDLTPDGRSVIYEQHDQQGGWDIWMRSLDGAGPVPLVRSPQNDQDPAMSPDGRFLAYSSPESGGRQVYVVPVPLDGRRWRVSSDYGREPEWGADGRTLFFHGLDRTLMRVEMDTSRPVPTIGTAAGMFQIPFLGYDMRYHFGTMRDGRRFLVNAPAESMAPIPATVIVNAPLP